MVSIHMVSNLKTAADVGLFVLSISLLLAALPGLGFDNVRTGFALLDAGLLCGLILIWTQILNEFFPGYKSMHRLILTGVLLAVLMVLGIVGRAHAAQKPRAGADYIKAAQTNCSMISDGFPPSVTTVRDAGIGQEKVLHIRLHPGNNSAESGCEAPLCFPHYRRWD
jgi:hypothetical protein